mmetsp:Transcript_43605/g.120657  ORF Transcript_43605/g.120657 Transcript_43605/m.120657 type:complete len:225 (+) Transcript_43605:77-751(+)
MCAAVDPHPLSCAFLDAYAASTRPVLPSFKAKVLPYGCAEIDGHKYYMIECALEMQPHTRAEWGVQLRLCTLRAEVHDVVKKALGEEYYEHFHPDARFAAHSGVVPGTLHRLQNWLQRLAELVSRGRVPRPVLESVLNALLRPPCAAAEATDAKKHPWCASRPLMVTTHGFHCDDGHSSLRDAASATIRRPRYDLASDGEAPSPIEWPADYLHGPVTVTRTWLS